MNGVTKYKNFTMNMINPRLYKHPFVVRDVGEWKKDFVDDTGVEDPIKYMLGLMDEN